MLHEQHNFISSSFYTIFTQIMLQQAVFVFGRGISQGAIHRPFWKI